MSEIIFHAVFQVKQQHLEEFIEVIEEFELRLVVDVAGDHEMSGLLRGD